MIQQAQAKIFLSDQRGLHETATCRSRYTFNYGNYFNEHRHPFGDLYALNEDTLAGGAVIEKQATENTCIVLIPVMGAIACKLNGGDNQLTAAGQAQAIVVEKNTTITISNPFLNDHVSYLQLWFKNNDTEQGNKSHTYTYDDVNENINRLVNAIATNNDALQLLFNLSVGKFSGRGETSYIPTNNNSTLFLFVIAGAFEAAGRLLHAGDGLALWNSSDAEMEALSNDAIMLVVELPQA